MKTVDTVAGSFDESRFRKLNKAYSEAAINNRSVFIFEEQLMLTKFAYYLLEYLKLKFM